jgi:hypothetical protein
VRDSKLKRHIEARDLGTDYRPQLVVCETGAAIVLHLRLEDGTQKLGGGLDLTKLLCNSDDRLVALVGWDTRIPAPDGPAEARKVTQAPRYCRHCVDAWETLL